MKNNTYRSMIICLFFAFQSAFSQDAPEEIEVHESGASDASISSSSNEKCGKQYNVNEIIYRIEHDFPNQLVSCAGKLAGEMIGTAITKESAPEIKSSMTNCVVDGMKKNMEGYMPDFSRAQKIRSDIQSFTQNYIDNKPDINQLTITSGLDLGDLLDDIEDVMESYACIVYEPYTPTGASAALSTNTLIATFASALVAAILAVVLK